MTSRLKHSESIPKTIVLYGHRYRIVYVTNTKSGAERAAKGMYKAESGVIIRPVSHGRWAVAVRDTRQMRRFMTGR